MSSKKVLFSVIFTHLQLVGRHSVRMWSTARQKQLLSLTKHTHDDGLWLTGNKNHKRKTHRATSCSSVCAIQIQAYFLPSSFSLWPQSNTKTFFVGSQHKKKKKLWCKGFNVIVLWELSFLFENFFLLHCKFVLIWGHFSVQGQLYFINGTTF